MFSFYKTEFCQFTYMGQGGGVLMNPDFDRMKNIVGKGENADLRLCSLCVLKPFCWVKKKS